MNPGNTNLLKDLLRVLTPNEINELTTKSDGDNLAPLAEILAEKVEEIEFHRNFEGQEYRKKVSYRAGKSASKLFRFVGVKNSKTIMIVLEKKSSAEIKKHSIGNGHSSDQKSDSDFLNIKEKLNDAYKKTKSKEVLCLYQSYAEIDINQLRTTKDDLKKSAHSGNLINKRQA